MFTRSVKHGNILNMKTISFYTAEGNLTRRHGYSEAAFNIVTSIQNNNHKVLFNDPEPNVQLNFCQPVYFGDIIRAEQYNIALIPWESTSIPEHWRDPLQDCNELWATSTWVKNMWEDLGFKVTHVYPHGINAAWAPKKKRTGDVVKFLHHGEPASRKGGQLAYNAFKKAFGDRDDVCLYLKTKDYTRVRNYVNGSIVGDLNKNVKVFSADLEEEDLIKVYQQCDFMVYPSYGEGFGLIPLQALATGTPTVCTGEWAEYKDYLGDLAIDSSYIRSPWPEEHPGNVLLPDEDDLVDKLRYCLDNIDKLHDEYYRKSFKVHSSYDWNKLTGQALKTLQITT